MRKICFRDGPIKRVRHGLDGKIDAMLAQLRELAETLEADRERQD